ncbi:MAG: VTT domain-containing protein [Acidimicrobiales bacterium]
MSPSDETRRWPRLVLAALWVAAVVAWLAISRSRGIGPAEAADSLRDLLASGWWGPLLYVAIYAVRPLVLFPASVLTILGGIVFGPVYGVAYTAIGANLSTAVTFQASRLLAGRRVLRPPVGKRAVERLVANPVETTLVLRLVAAPFDAVAVAAGVLGLDFKAFMAASFLGTIAGTIAFVSFGSSIESLTDGQPSIDAPLLALSIGLTAAGLLVSRWLRSRRPELAA